MAKRNPQPGDKCPRCKEGLLERDALGIACDNCGWHQNNEELVRQDEERAKAEAGDFKKAKISIIIDDPETAEHFLQGLIIARSNNSSQYFEELIDGVNAVLQPYRLKRIQEQHA
jgi:uncharacterized Zn finger protein (UPF0148 family)